jgi:quercetin dioxygenase-like cupin family protein
MADPGDILREPSGVELVYVETSGSTDGRRLVLDWTVPPGVRLVARAHRHPAGPEGWEVLDGQARYRVARQELAAGAGDAWEVPTNTSHVHPWNVGSAPLRVRQTIDTGATDIPGLTLGIERFFETLMAFAQRGQVDEAFDISPLLQNALTIREFLMPGSYLAGPPTFVQNALFAALAAIARRRGLEPYAEPERGRADV